jgi:ADP-dependent NAD(P)H-hydrate dehydratase
VKRGSRAAATQITAALLRKWPLPEVHPKLGKEGRGSVLVVGASAQIPGAAILAGLGALRAGAGKLHIATARSVSCQVAVVVPEARVSGLPQTRKGELAPGCYRILAPDIEAADVLLLGPGMCDERAAVDLVQQCARARSRPTLIADAAALGIFKDRKPLSPAYRGEVIATPHAGEMAKLWGCSRDEVLARPLALAREAAASLGIVIALKGAQTFVVAPDGTAYRNTAGNVGLGTSGSGDMLSGVIAGLSARGASALQAAVWGVYLHAKAGDVLARRIGPLGFLARELLSEIPPLLVKVAR